VLPRKASSGTHESVTIPVCGRLMRNLTVLAGGLCPQYYYRRVSSIFLPAALSGWRAAMGNAFWSPGVLAGRAGLSSASLDDRKIR
jgi:hypothetical protein